MSLQLRIFKNLIAQDLLIFKNLFINKWLDRSVGLAIEIYVVAYILPYFGLSNTFAVIQFCGMIALVGLWQLFGNCVTLISDFQGNKSINYYLTLPVSCTVVFLSKIIAYTLSSVVLTIALFPLGKIVLWNIFTFEQFSLIKFLIAISGANLFFGCCTLWFASVITDIERIDSIWSRYIFPLWFLGGFIYTWKALYNKVPVLAYVCLFNPIMYVTEAMRSSILGQEGYINFWLCMSVVIFFCVAMFLIAVGSLRKRLDFV